MTHQTRAEYKLENWKRVWQCRDFELSHLWQRSAFLTVFLILIYSGYGSYIQILLKPIAPNEYMNSTAIHHIIALGMCFIGYIFSILWICMAKGSKYWYQCYESKIDEVEENSFNNLLNAHTIIHKKSINGNLFNKEAYRYSVSAINIMIGQISLIIWIILGIVHLVFIYIKLGYILPKIDNIFVFVFVGVSSMYFICKQLDSEDRSIWKLFLDLENRFSQYKDTENKKKNNKDLERKKSDFDKDGTEK